MTANRPNQTSRGWKEAQTPQCKQTHIYNLEVVSRDNLLVSMTTNNKGYGTECAGGWGGGIEVWDLVWCNGRCLWWSRGGDCGGYMEGTLEVLGIIKMKLSSIIFIKQLNLSPVELRGNVYVNVLIGCHRSIQNCVPSVWCHIMQHISYIFLIFHNVPLSVDERTSMCSLRIHPELIELDRTM